MLNRKTLIICLLLFLFICRRVVAIDGIYSFQHSGNGIISNESMIEIKEGIEIREREDVLSNNELLLFGKIYTFETKDIGFNGKGINHAYEVGIQKNNLLTIKQNNRFSLELSYYEPTIIYDKSLYLTHIDEIYKKAKAGIIYDYDNNNLLFEIFYNKFLDSFKNSLNFTLEKSLFKNNYFKSSVGFEYYKNIDVTDNETRTYTYNGKAYIQQTRDLLNRSNTLYWNTKITLTQYFDVILNVRLVDSNTYGHYSTFGIGFRFFGGNGGGRLLIFN
jgi:hypothetical protein